MRVSVGGGERLARPLIVRGDLELLVPPGVDDSASTTIYKTSLIELLLVQPPPTSKLHQQPDYHSLRPTCTLSHSSSLSSSLPSPSPARTKSSSILTAPLPTFKFPVMATTSPARTPSTAMSLLPSLLLGPAAAWMATTALQLSSRSTALEPARAISLSSLVSAA